KLVARQLTERQDHEVGEEEARRSAKVRPRRDDPVIFTRTRPFHRQQDRATPFAADPDTLDEAQGDQHHRAPNADLLIGRDAADKKRRQTGQEERRDQRRFAADTVAVRPKIAAPIGRAAKPTAKTANDCSAPINGSDEGKYSLAKTIAAIWP